MIKEGQESKTKEVESVYQGCIYAEIFGPTLSHLKPEIGLKLKFPKYFHLYYAREGEKKHAGFSPQINF